MVALHIKTEQQDSVGTLADVVTMETDTDLSKHEMNLALNQDVMLHVEYNCQKYDNHVTIKKEPLPLNSVNMGHLIADTDENLAVKSENQFIDMLEDDENKVVKLESSLHDSCDFDQNKMMKREPDSTEFSTGTQFSKKTANMMHIHHSKEPLKTTANTLPLNNPGTGIQDNRLVETVTGMPAMPITDTRYQKTTLKLLPCLNLKQVKVTITPEEIWPCARRMTSEANALPDRYDVKITKKAETEKETYVLLYNVETKQNKEKEYIKVCDQVQGQTERGKSQIGRPVFMYNQVTGKVQNVEIEIGNSNTSNGKRIRANRPSNIKNN
ncbi:unnamed protein product [Mytilus edulis]|uniref:Uncharacterized protein n=1 Tax=Mytilus edulis TaxID=6550 RepID=A0A8S3PZZ9_MYTED|nr:unnamed protein product [Mytilus edulis]